MSHFAAFVAYLAFAGALASWIAGACFFARSLQTLSGEPGQRRLPWFTVATWPFAIARLKGAAAAQAANVNKALVALFACLMIAVAATSVATNLARVSR